MTVTDLKPGTRGRKEVYIDEEYVFSMYPSELRAHPLKTGEDISPEYFDEIVKKVILKRGKKRAMMLLQKQDRTISDITAKLKKGGYTDLVIPDIIEFLRSYHYVDDVRYARNFISFYADQYSSTRLRQKLMTRGVSRENIDRAFAESDDQIDFEKNDRLLMVKELDKKLKTLHGERPDDRDWNRFTGYLLRHGFPSSAVYSLIRQKRNEYDDM